MADPAFAEASFLVFCAGLRELKAGKLAVMFAGLHRAAVCVIDPLLIARSKRVCSFARAARVETGATPPGRITPRPT